VRDEEFVIPQSEGTVIERIVGGVRAAIAQGVLSPGQRLTEREVIERTGASRTSVREAFARLRRLRLLEESARGGLQVPELRPTTIEHIFELRGAVESAAAELFTLRASDDEVAKLCQLNDDFVHNIDRLVGKDPSNSGEYSQPYDFIIRGSRNPILADIVAPFLVRIQPLRVLSLSVPSRQRAVKFEKNRLVDAVCRRDPDRAAGAIRAHIAASRESILCAFWDTASVDDGYRTAAHA